jgi:hypothetical protein
MYFRRHGMLEDFDKQVSVFTESVVRRLSRRKMVTRTVKGLFATVALAAIGQGTGLTKAFAANPCTCDDGWTTGHLCNYYGYKCPSNGCPSGCSLCHSNDCGGWCNWSSGQWVSCSHQGHSGRGYKLCWDCKCTTCTNKCSCLSQCFGC